MKFRLIMLESPAYTMNDTLSQKVFSRMIHSKTEGYEASYGDGVLPVDKSDFFAIHAIFCEERDNDYFPIFSYKIVTEEICKRFNFELPILNIARSDQDIKSEILEINQSDKNTTSYMGSMAISPSYKTNKRALSKVKEFLYSSFAGMINEYNLGEIWSAGVTRNSAYRLIEGSGFSRFSPIPVVLAEFDDEPVFIERFSGLSEQMIQKISTSDLWERRIHVRSSKIKRKSEPTVQINHTQPMI